MGQPVPGDRWSVKKVVCCSWQARHVSCGRQSCTYEAVSPVLCRPNFRMLVAESVECGGSGGRLRMHEHVRGEALGVVLVCGQEQVCLCAARS